MLRRTWLWFSVAVAGCASQTPPPAAPAPTPTQAPVPAQSAEPAPLSAAAPTDGTAAPTDGTRPVVVPPSALERLRTKGSVAIAPDDLDKMRMAERKLTRVMHSSKLCLGIDGHVASVTTLKSSGLPAYDEKIRKQIGEWEYVPYQVDGKPSAVCTAVTFIYSQPLPVPAP